MPEARSGRRPPGRGPGTSIMGASSETGREDRVSSLRQGRAKGCRKGRRACRPSRAAQTPLRHLAGNNKTTSQESLRSDTYLPRINQRTASIPLLLGGLWTSRRFVPSPKRRQVVNQTPQTPRSTPHSRLTKANVNRRSSTCRRECQDLSMT